MESQLSHSGVSFAERQPFNEKGLILVDPLEQTMGEARKIDPMADERFARGCHKIDRAERLRPQIEKEKRMKIKEYKLMRKAWAAKEY